MNLDWGDVPTGVASFGTVAAVSVALWQVGAERRTEKRRAIRAQAEEISAWYAGDRNDVSDLVLRNGSEQPIYEVVVTLVLNNRDGHGVHDDFRRVFLEVPPGSFRLEVPSSWHGMSASPGVEVGFTDRTGEAHWLRRADGLAAMTQSAIEHYDISRPFHYLVVSALGDE